MAAKIMLAVLTAWLLVPVLCWAAEQAAPAQQKPWPFFAFCMDTHDAKKRSLQQQAELLKELGYDGAGHLWLDNAAERLKTLDQAGLKLFQIYMKLSLDAKPSGDRQPISKQPEIGVSPRWPSYDVRLKDVLRLLKSSGDRQPISQQPEIGVSRRCPTMLAVLVGGGKPSDASLDGRAAQLLREIADLAEPQGVRVVLYPHVGDWLEKFDDAIRVARKVDRPGVGVMFNLCHFLKVSDERNIKGLLEQAGPLLMAVSINGCDGSAEIRAGKGKWIVPLDEGNFDMAVLLKTLKGVNYPGPVGIQCYGIGGDAREHLARSIAVWRRMNSTPTTPQTTQ